MIEDSDFLQVRLSMKELISVVPSLFRQKAMMIFLVWYLDTKDPAIFMLCPGSRSVKFIGGLGMENAQKLRQVLRLRYDDISIGLKFLNSLQRWV